MNKIKFYLLQIHIDFKFYKSNTPKTLSWIVWVTATQVIRRLELKVQNWSGRPIRLPTYKISKLVGCESQDSISKHAHTQSINTCIITFILYYILSYLFSYHASQIFKFICFYYFQFNQHISDIVITVFLFTTVHIRNL